MLATAGTEPSREFATFALSRTSPIAGNLRRLAAHAYAECGGPGVGAVGMCFTDTLALAMAVDDRILAPGAQPARVADPGRSSAPRRCEPVGGGPGHVKRRAAEDGLWVLGLRFSEDRGSPGDRFDALRRGLGDAFIAVKIDSSPGSPTASRRANSVLTGDLTDVPGRPTRAALDQVMATAGRRW